jgi:hypothetical protein
VFPMMSDEELAKLGEDIKKHGVRVPVGFWGKYDGNGRFHGELIDGRNRLEAAERAGLDLDEIHRANLTCGDPVSWIIALNIHRRHLTKQQQADLIVAAMKAGKAIPRQRGEKSKKAGRPKHDIKAKAIAEAEKHDISKRTVERSLAKAEGRTPKPKGVADDETNSRRRRSALEMARGAAESARALREFEDTLEIDDKLLAACRKAANAWSKLLARLEQKRASTLPQDGRNGTGLDHSTSAK